jgi:hypothetical protein
MKSKAILKLISRKITKAISSKLPVWDRGDLLLINDFTQWQIDFVEVLMEEAVENGFEVRICKSKK